MRNFIIKMKILICSLLLISFANAENRICKTTKIIKERAAKTVGWIKNHKKTCAAVSAASIATAAVYLRGFYKLYTLNRCNNKQLFLWLLLQWDYNYFWAQKINIITN